MARCLGCHSNGELLQWADDKHIEGGGTSEAPAGRKGEFGSQGLSQGSSWSRGLESSIDNVEDSVVQGDTVTIPATTDLRISGAATGGSLVQELLESGLIDNVTEAFLPKREGMNAKKKE